MKRRTLLVAACAAIAARAAAQPAGKPGGVYPSRPLRLIAPPLDALTRAIAPLVARELSQALGQPVVLDDRVSVAGIAADLASSAAPGGYTLFLLGPEALFGETARTVEALAAVSLIAAPVTGDTALEFCGLFVPANTPRNIVAHLHAHAVHILAQERVRAFFAEAGARPVGDDAEVLERVVDAAARKRTGSAAPR